MVEQIDLLQFPKIKRELGRRTEEHRRIAREFGREFFDGSRDTGYGGYVCDDVWRPRWAAVAQRMIDRYQLMPYSTVLDIGCAKGFLVEALENAGTFAMGVDVSYYALQCAAPSIRGNLLLRSADDLPDRGFDLVVSINTLHNMKRLEIVNVLKGIRSNSRHSYITLDAYRTDEERERMMAWNLTAKTILHVDEWLELFKEAGYTGDYDWFMP